MGIIDRIILSIYTFLLAFLSLGVILLSLRLISLDLVWTGISQISGRWEAGLVGAVFLLISIRLLLAGMRSRLVKDTIVHHNDMGDIHISLDAIKNLVEKMARHTRGVRSVKASIKRDGQGLKVYLKAVVSPEVHVPSVTAELQKRIHDHIKDTVGIELADVQILVESISNDFKAKQRVE
jgi:uncharacterized alkaline shock family protein YloU